MIGQGVVLMIAGMGIVYVFLTVLIFVTKISCAGVAKFDSILPEEPSKKPAAKKPAAKPVKKAAAAKPKKEEKPVG